jgi:hypothetical protein
VTGAKPAAFCRRLFGLLGAATGDTLDDLYPGSGAVSQAPARTPARSSVQAALEVRRPQSTRSDDQQDLMTDHSG